MSKSYESIEGKVSYGIGLQLGNQLKNEPVPGLDLSIVIEGLRDAFEGAELKVAASDLQKAFAEFNEKHQAQKAKQAETLSAEGKAFLDENAKRSEITVTESGLQYEILTAAEGEKPKASSTVKTHYHGMLISGKVFDSSYDRGEPVEFPVDGVIAGWTEALQLMSVGAKWRLYIPYNLAYGERGAGEDIGPYQTLIFDVELLAITA